MPLLPRSSLSSRAAGAATLALALAATLPGAPTAYFVNASSAADGGVTYAGLGSGNVGNLRYCIAQANANGNPEGSVITITNATTTLVAPLPPIKVGLVIQSEINAGLGYGPNTIDAASNGRVFFIDAPSGFVTLSDLVLRNGYARGGAGGAGGGGGGGGAGMGGAIFVNDGSVYAARVFTFDTLAQGGAGGGGNGAGAVQPGGGGGGGLGGAGGPELGGGGGLNAAGGPGGNNGFGGATRAGGGGGGIWGNGGQGVQAGGGGGGLVNGANSSGSNGGAGGGGIGGNGGGPGLPGAAGGTGGGGGGSGPIPAGGQLANGGAGGQSGGGGGGSDTGGTGGDFGGGGAGNMTGGQGGFGGGGGGGFNAGNGGYGGGAGGIKVSGITKLGGAYGGASGPANPGDPGSAGGGGGGAGLGGAFFVRRGILNLVDCGLPTRSQVLGGIGGAAQVGGARGGTGGTAGQAHFLYGGRTLLTYNTDATIDYPIAGEAGDLSKSGSAILTLSAPNSYGGYTEALLGTLRLTGAGTLGSNSAPLYVRNLATLDLAGASASAGYVLVEAGGQIINSSGLPATLTVGVGNSVDGIQYGAMSGNLALTKVAGGNHTLAAPQPYTGATLVAAGTLVLDTTGAGSPILPNTSSITVNAGGSINLTGTSSNAIAANLPVTVSGLLFSLAPSWHTLNALTINGGTITGIGTNAQFGNYVLNAGTWTSNGTSTVNATEVQLRNNPGPPTFQVASGTLTVASRLTDHNFTGGVYQQVGGLTKAGPGTLVLSGANTYSGGTFLNAGTLTVKATGTLGAVGGTTIASGATLDVTAFGAGGFPLASGRTLTNNGTVLGVLAVSGLLQGDGALQGGLVINTGAVVARGAGSTLAVTGPLTNNGTLRFAGGAVLNASGVTSFVNNGVLDLITAGPGTLATLPTITGSGLVLTAESVRVKAASRAGADVTVTMDGYTGHTFALQRTTSLGVAFAAVPGVPAQPGSTGSTLTFVDPAAPAGEVFYRVLVSP